MSSCQSIVLFQCNVTFIILACWPPVKRRISIVSVCLSDDIFREPWLTLFAHSIDLQRIWVMQVRIWRSSGQGQGHTSKKGRKSLFLQKSLGNNSGSIKHRTMKFACSMGFSVMTDRMVCPPYLLSKRKWARVTTCVHSRVVGLKLVDNLVLVYVAYDFTVYRFSCCQ